MKDLAATLFPYCRRYWLRYLLGFVCIGLTNFLYVRAMVVIGEAVDYVVQPDAGFLGVWPYIGKMLLYVFVGAVSQYYQRMFIIVVSRRIEFEFRNDFFRHLLRLTPAFYDRMKTGDIISRATTDVDQVRMAIGPGVMYPLNALFSIPITFHAMVSSSWPVTLACCAPLVVLPWFVRYLANAMYHRSLALQEHYSEFSGRIQESISGIRVIKSFVQAPRELQVLDGMSQEYARLNMRMAVIQAMFFPMMILLFGVGNGIIIWVGAHYIGEGAQLTDPRYLSKGELVAFTVLYGNLFFPLLGFGWVMSVYQRASASMHRIKLIWNQQPEVIDGQAVEGDGPQRGEIELRGLTYRYPGEEKPALEDIDLHLPAGGTLGVIGSVGSGKSTIGQLLLRLYETPPGQVLIDGRDVRDYPLAALRRAIGVVFQETYLFSDTISENINFGRQEPAPQDQVEEYARISDVEKDIVEFPERFETMLGERGINLSGGQKQRVSLARALACEAPILILDDAFSAVDTHTEEHILEAMRDVMRKRTTILISHRISTVKQADEIIVLDKGRIAERGTHDELVALGGLYADIHHRQLLEEAIEEED